MDNTCVCCGAVIPEGRLICYICEKYGVEIPMRKEDGKHGQTDHESLG